MNKIKAWGDKTTIKDWVRSQDWVNIGIVVLFAMIFTFQVVTKDTKFSTAALLLATTFSLRATIWEHGYRKKLAAYRRFLK